MKTKLRVVKYQVDPSGDSSKSGWVYEGYRHDGPTKDAASMINFALGHIAQEGRVLQIIELPNTEFQTHPHYGILVETP